MGMSFAHTLEMPGRRLYDGQLWWHLSRTLYRPLWGWAGQLEGVALGAAPALASLVRDRRPAFGLTMAASACLLTANPLIFFRFVRSANLATLDATPDELPADWQRLRDQGEYGHAARFALHLLASALSNTPGPAPRL